MTQEDIEKVFRKKANAEVYDGMYAREFGFIAQMGKINHRDREIDDDNKKNKSASQFAESCEHFFKAPIIYHDLRNSNIILNSNPNDFDDVLEEHLKSPKKIQGLLLGNDPRKNKSLIAPQNVQNDKVSGHDLYAYYQLQNPVFNALINHEYLTRDGEDIFNWINFGILTQDYLEYDSNNSLKMPMELPELLDKNKSSFETLRYTSTHGGSKAATSQDIDFLIHLSGGLENIMDILYPQYDEQFDFDSSKLKKELGFSINEYRMPGSIKKTFKRLDKISNFYLNNEFSKKEFEFFVEQLSKINSDSSISDNEKMIYRSVYTNLCIYLKHCTRMIEATIYFDQKVFERIEKYCRLVITSNLFDKNSVKLKDNTFFITHKSELQAELELNRKQTSLNNRKNKIYKKFNITSDICLTEEDLEILENAEKYKIFKINPELFRNTVLLINSPSVLIRMESMKEYQEHPEMFTPQILANNTVSQVVNIINSNEYKLNQGMFTTEILVRNTLERVQKLLSSSEYKEHPDLFTKKVLGYATIEEIQNLLRSDEFKNYPEFFTPITLKYTRLDKIKEVIHSEAFREHPEMFSPNILRVYAVEKIKAIIDLCKCLNIEVSTRLLVYDFDRISETIKLCSKYNIDFDPLLINLKPSVILKKKKIFEKLGLEYTSKDFLKSMNFIIKRSDLCDKLGVELNEFIISMSPKEFNKYEENRFKFLKNNNIEKLIDIKENLIEENEYMMKNSNSYLQKMEFYNDIRNNMDEINFINKLIENNDSINYKNLNYKNVKNLNINNKINYKDINYKINERPYIVENPYIGKDGKDYYSREALDEANRVYYEKYEQEKGHRR